jgi:hypothetical protein
MLINGAGMPCQMLIFSHLKGSMNHLAFSLPPATLKRESPVYSDGQAVPFRVLLRPEAGLECRSCDQPKGWLTAYRLNMNQPIEPYEESYALQQVQPFTSHRHSCVTT